MSDSARPTALLQALRRLLPDAVISVANQKPWHSITFGGTQLCLSVNLAGGGRHDAVAEFMRRLPEHEFSLRHQLVADIAVTECVAGDEQTRLTIHALLLDD